MTNRNSMVPSSKAPTEKHWELKKVWYDQEHQEKTKERNNTKSRWTLREDHHEHKRGGGGDSLGKTLGRNEKYQEKDQNQKKDHHEHKRERGGSIHKK